MKLTLIKDKFLLYCYTLTFFLSLLTSDVKGQDDLDVDVDYLFSLSLEQLLNIKVSIATSKSESISNTPAIVSTYQMSDIMQQGVRSLKEALSLIPGIVIDEALFGNATVMLRGTTDLFGSKVLFLLDGIPYWGPSHNTIPLLGIPIQAIDRIEMIRGPGAVIYGTNAISGVINIITNTQTGNKIVVTLGSDNHINTSGYWAKEFDDKSQLSFSFENQNQEGYVGEYRYQDVRINMPKRKESSSAMLRYGNDNLNMLAHYFESESQGRNAPSYVNSAPLYDIPMYIGYDGYLLHGDYTWNLDSSSVEFYSDYNKFSSTFFRTFDELRFEHNGSDNYRLRTGLKYSNNIQSIKNLSLLAGIEYELRSIGTYQLFPTSNPTVPLLNVIEADSTNEKSTYLQFDYQREKWRYLLGARLTNNEKAGQKVTPRASVIYSIDDNQSIKFLYAVGFTSPNFIFSSIDLPGTIQGQIDNKAETIATFDLAYTYTTPTMLFVINAYSFKGDDFLSRTRNPDGNGDIYSNAEKFDREGLEIDFKKKFGQWSLVANASYNHEGNKTITNDAAAIAVPRSVLNFGGTYILDENHLLGLSIQSVSKRSTSDSYLVANLNYEYQANNFNFFLTLRNITGDDPHNPDAAAGTPEVSHPKDDPEINFLVGVKYQFE